MKIKYIKVKNFLSIGNNPLEINFENYGNIIQIKGKNLDYGENNSNGSGKTTCILSIIYALYGKLVKGLNHKKVINAKNKKNLEIELHFDNCKIIRKRYPDELLLWEGGQQLTLGGMPETQNEINKIIGLNYKAFCNVFLFGQHNKNTFLQCDPAEKRAVAENLLSLDKYVKFSKNAKDKKAYYQTKLSEELVNYENIGSNLSLAEKRLNSLLSDQKKWITVKDNRIAALKSELVKQETLLKNAKDSSLIENYDSIQSEISSLNERLDQLEEQRAKFYSLAERLDKAINSKHDEVQELSMTYSNIQRETKLINDDINELRKKNYGIQEGSICSVCMGEITKNNVDRVIEYNQSKINEKKKKIDSLNGKAEEEKTKLDENKVKLNNLVENRRELRDKESILISKLNGCISRRSELSKIQKPQVDPQTLLIKKEISYLTEQLKIKQEEKDPYQDLVTQTNKELDNYRNDLAVSKNKIQDIEILIPYYNFWINGFGDDGIRSFVISEIVPALNSNINYWLQFLIDNKIKVCFNNKLEEIIERTTGEESEFVYDALSGGEHQRIDLAIAFAFAHIMMLTSGSCPSLIALDEVGTDLDQPGIDAVYRAICELAKDRQVLVTTHHPSLQEMLSSHDCIEIVRKDGFSEIIKD